jgi:hypothetical protein
MAGYDLTPEDRLSIDEFRQRPIGPHSPNLQRILNRMRGAPNAGKYCLICTRPFAEWQLARMSGRRGVPPTPIPGEIFTDLAAAEWAVFRRRWRELTGEDIN